MSKFYLWLIPRCSCKTEVMENKRRGQVQRLYVQVLSTHHLTLWIIDICHQEKKSDIIETILKHETVKRMEIIIDNRTSFSSNVVPLKSSYFQQPIQRMNILNHSGAELGTPPRFCVLKREWPNINGDVSHRWSRQGTTAMVCTLLLETWHSSLDPEFWFQFLLRHQSLQLPS